MTIANNIIGVIKVIEKLISLIAKENNKKPMTDEDIAKELSITREFANQLRLEASIPSYLERREKVLLKVIDEIVLRDKNISVRKLTIELNKIGFNISTFGLNKYKEHVEILKNNGQLLKESPACNVKKKKSKVFEKEFYGLIGVNGSLSNVVKLAKAAVLYPPNGLHTLISGSTGVGKSQLVEHIHSFAKTVRNARIPLVVFNCSDYADNPQLLVSYLFGHSKGSFTGADSNKEGVVERADGGILFLDEIHRLPPKGQELLFRIIDKGEFNRLGETIKPRKVNVMIIGATTENIESNLLSTFRRRIPVLIEVPSLEERPVIERMQLIKKFFTMEALRISNQLYIPSEILKCFLTYKCPGNVGQLKSDIQVTCARAFMDSISMNSSKIRIINNDLPKHLKKHILVISGKDLKYINIQDLNIIPNSDDGVEAVEADVFKDNIYQFIEKRMDELKNEKFSLEERKQLLSRELEEKVITYSFDVENKYYGISKKLLQDIVGEEVIGFVDDIKSILLSEIGNNDFNIFNVLCLHLSTAIERIRMGKEILNPKLEYIQKNYKKEYNIALKITDLLKIKLGLAFPKDEAGFIALYLNRLQSNCQSKNSNRVGVIVISHGQVSKAILDVAQCLVGIDYGTAITMTLSEKPEEVYLRVKEIAKQVDEGRGIMILVDMGSLTTFGDLITADLGIPTRTIARVDTLMVIEVLRKSVQEKVTLDMIYNSVLDLENLLPRGVKILNKSNNLVKRKTIVTTCITGKGSAIKIKKILDEKLITMNLDIVPLGFIGEKDILREIEKLKKDKDIVAIVGTVDPRHIDIPFISFENILYGEKLDKLLNIIDIKNGVITSSNYNLTICDLFDSQTVRIFDYSDSKEEAIRAMVKVMVAQGYVSDGFYQDVIDREEWGSSYIGNKVSIPHVSVVENIIKPGIGIAIFKNPIGWDDDEVEVMFILALKSEHKEMFLEVYSLIKDTDLIEKIKNCNDEKSVIMEVLDNDRRKNSI